MPAQCRICNRVSPAEANYCYFDGAFLQGSQLLGPEDVAQTPFALPFHFPSGETCQNFDQLALTCQQHWKETWELLRSHALANFLGQVGRADLIGVARQAAAEADPDRGVDYFLSRLPARNLAAARLEAAPVHMQLGKLKAGQDREFSVRLTNEGHRLIVGSITSDSAWLQVEAAGPGQPHLVQFTQEQAVRVRALGAQLPAGQQARAAKLLVESNAGTAEIAVSCEVPIVPFPEGVLAGCRSPREVAVKAKRALEEAGELFFQGKVQAWYRTNGWTYPVEGEPASGKAAVQQFFEALGLTKPPRVVLDTPALGFQGPPGKLLRQNVQLHTDDKRPIFAFGRAASPWLSVVGHATHTNRAVLAIEVNVPHVGMQRLETHVEVRANGNQRFRVPVVLNVEAAPPGEYVPADDFAGMAAGDAAAPGAQATPHAAAGSGAVGGGCLLYAGVTLFLFALLISCGGAVGLYFYRNPDTFAGPSPLEHYKAAIGPQTCVVGSVDLVALEEIPALDDPIRQLRQGIGLQFRDLDLQGDDTKPRRLFVALARGERPLLVWKFGAPVKFGNPGPGRYEIDGAQSARICVDRLDPTLAWAVDKQGHLLGGPPGVVRAALEREKKGGPNPAYAHIERAARGIPAGAPAWLAGDFEAAGKQVQVGALGEESPHPFLEHFYLALEAESPKRFVVRGKGAFSSPTAAAAWRDDVRALSNSAIPLLPAAIDFGNLVREPSAWEAVENDLRVSVKFDIDTTSAVLRSAAADLDREDQRTKGLLEERSRQFCEPGKKAAKDGDFPRAIEIFERAIALYPNHGDARKLLDTARKSLNERNSYEAALKSIRDALERRDIAAARTAADKLRDSPLRDRQFDDLEKQLAGAVDLEEFDKELKEAQRLAGLDMLDKARDAFKRAGALKPGDRTAANGLAAVKRIQEVQAVLKQADQQVRAQQPEAAQQVLMKCLDGLVQEAKAPVWADEPFKKRRVKLLKEGALACRQVCDAFKSASDTARASADSLLKQKQFVEGRKLYEKAQDQLQRTKNALGDLRRIGGDDTVSATELKAIDADLEMFRNSDKKIKLQSLLAEGNKGLELAKAAFVEAPADPKLVGPAVTAVDATLKLFREAEELEPRVATEPIREAEALRKSFARVLRPVQLDLSAALSSADWVFQKDQWVRKPDEGKPWLQAVPYAAVQLKSATQEWPAEFVLTMEFALVGAKKNVLNNSLWVNFPDPVKLVLHRAKGNPTTITLGRDPSPLGQNFARLQQDKAQIAFGVGAFPKAEPLRLVVQRKNGILEVKLGQRALPAVKLADTIDALTLHVDNPDMELLGQRWYVAIYRLDVAWTGLEDEKAKSP